MNYKSRETTSFKSILKYIFFSLAIGGALFYIGSSFLLNRKVAALTPNQKKAAIIGHAGSAFFSPLNPFNPLPPNSMASLLKAMNDGAEGLEIDVQLSQDGVPVLFHDEKLAGMTSGQGLIGHLPAVKLIGLPYTGGFFYELFHNEKVVSLEDLLKKLAAYPEKPDLHLDLRNYSNLPPHDYARTLMPVLRQYAYPAHKLWFVTEDEKLLAAFRELEPQAFFLLDMDKPYEESLKIVLDHKLHGVVASSQLIDAARMKELRQHQLQVVLFGGKARSSIYNMLLLQPDAIEVNNVAAMHEMIR